MFNYFFFFSFSEHAFQVNSYKFHMGKLKLGGWFSRICFRLGQKGCKLISNYDPGLINWFIIMECFRGSNSQGIHSD